MIAHPQMLQPTRRQVFATGRILSARTVAWMRETAAALRNESTVALIGGDRNAAQVALSQAEEIEVELGEIERGGVCFFDVLCGEYGSEVAR